MERVLEWVRTVVFYLILVSAIMHILPDKQYTKYVQLFVGLLLILITMEPMIQFFDQDHLIDTIYQKEVYWQEYESQQELLEQLNHQEQQSIVEAYEKQLNSHLTQWFEQKGYIVNGVQVHIEEKGVKSIYADIERELQETKTMMKEQSSLNNEQNETRELKQALAEIYEISLKQISLKIR